MTQALVEGKQVPRLRVRACMVWDRENEGGLGEVLQPHARRVHRGVEPANTAHRLPCAHAGLPCAHAADCTCTRACEPMPRYVGMHTRFPVCTWRAC